MMLRLENVGAIKKASVNLTGLTIIAGKNGTGKSTIGKTVYTIIKAVKEKDKILEETRKQSAEMLCMRTFFTLQNDIKNYDARVGITGGNVNNDAVLLRTQFELNVFARILIELIDKGQLEEAQSLVYSRLKIISEFSDKVGTQTKNLASSFLQTLIDQLKSKDFINDVHAALSYMYNKVFNYQINNLVSHETSKITFDNFLSYSVSNNADVLSFSKRLYINKVEPNIQSTIFQNATLIETPLILQLQKNEDTENIPTYWLDLIEKIKTGLKSNNTLLEGVLQDIYKEVNSLLGGSLEYNSDEQKMVFVKNEFNNGKLFVNNMSSGEKMLAIFQNFVKSGLLGPEHLLILDEPENHLHPEWQLALAKILTQLAGAGFPILVNSHSPDFIQALKIFSEEDENISSKTKFYLANMNTGVIEDKTDMVYEVLDELSTPINNIFREVLNRNKNV